MNEPLLLDAGKIPPPTLPIGERPHHCQLCLWDGKRADHPTHDKGARAIGEAGNWKPPEEHQATTS